MTKIAGDENPYVLLRDDERLRLKYWPELGATKALVGGPKSCLVLAAGFVDRSLTAVSMICRSSRNFRVILIRYLPFLEQNRESQIVTICRGAGASVEILEYDREQPAGIGADIAQRVAGCDEVYVDVSAMSRLLIVQAIVGVMELRRTFFLLYTEALCYPPEEQEFYDEISSEGPTPTFLSSGIFEVVSTPELSSVSMMGRPIRLVSFPSFDKSQLSNLVQEIQPTHNDVVLGAPPSKQLSWRNNAIYRLNEAAISSLQHVDVHEVSTLDYRETIRLILELYAKYAAFDRIVVAPTGSKMQAVAIGILRSALTDLQIVYPTPQEFVNPLRYTEGSRCIYSLTVEWSLA